MAQVLFFGASSVVGVGDPEGGWVDRFKREIHSKVYGSKKETRHDIYNLGISGNTAAQLLESIPYEMPARQWQQKPFVVVICIGTNDSRAEDSPNNFVSNSQEYMINLQNIVDYTRSYTPHIILVGLTPIDDTLTRPTADGRDYFAQARVKEFDTAMGEVARSNHLIKVDLYDSMLALDWRAMLYEDGLHLNAVGHEWMYQRIRQPVLMAMQATLRE